MKNKGKMIVGTALVLGIISIAFLATPIRALVNRNGLGNLLQTQERKKLMIRSCECNGDLLQEREQIRERTRTHKCDYSCTCNGTQQQTQTRQRNNECDVNRICGCTLGWEQHSYQYRERARNQAP